MICRMQESAATGAAHLECNSADETMSHSTPSAVVTYEQ